MELNLQTDEDILTTAEFRILNDKVFQGKQLVVLYDWLGDENFDIEFIQWDGKTTFRTISSGIGKTVYEAKNENEWNTTATSPLNTLFHSDRGFYFTVRIKLLNMLPSTARLDNFRVALVNANGVLYDLEGNEIKGVARKANDKEASTTIVTKTEQVKIAAGPIEGSVVDKKTIIILCSVGGAALCVIAVAIVLMTYYSKPKTKKVEEIEYYDEDEEDE